ncbi:hypothetical protein PN36_20635 [Candidatus Thiomargarita nelsonii]|uniref:Nucleotidyltransferase family protein n=1 Tax=Candidatus Thiomargarita nelsonii TaxID=1003181 RepID=A0A0A6PGM3_9GAMM|nr:hypothetical protein PN36_20635 [Candidatus Thiomargarita nelsonii]
MDLKKMLSEKLIELLLAYLCEQGEGDLCKLSNPEWKALLRLSTYHGVAPLFYHRLSHAGAQVPDGVLNALCKAYHGNVFQNAQYYHELSEVLKQLQRIDVIVLKGAYLAKTVYQSQALRFIGDIDLLVKKADLEQAEKILLEMGYGPTERPSIKAQCASHHLETFTKKGAFSIDIHWTLIKPEAPFKIMPDSLWEQARPFTVEDIQVLTLSPEDLLFHLCVHTAYSSRFFGIRFLCDIHNTIRSHEIDWEILFHRARQWKGEKTVYLVLSLARDWLATSVPEKVLEQFKPDDFNLELLAKTKEIITKDINPRVGENFARLWKPNKPFREKLLIFLKRIFLPPDELAEIYHAPKKSLRLYFYYPVRLKKYLVSYSGAVWRGLRSDKEKQVFMTQNERIAMLMDWMKSN